MAAFGSALAFFLALVLGAAAVHKLVSRERLARATGRLLRVNDGLAMPAMLAAAAVEACAAFALLLPATRPMGALIAVLLWAVYAIALWAAERRGDNALDCGCSFGVHARGIDRFTLLRPVVLALVALVVVAVPGAFDVTAPFAGLAFFAMYLAAGEIAASWRTA